MKKWENVFNAESVDGTWEITHHEEDKTVHLLFWDYKHQNTEDEILVNKTITVLTYEQFDSLLGFMNRMNKEE